jgi:hypothetical protein
MGQTVNVVEKPSSNPGMVRFETNRTISGTGHDRFAAGEPIEGNRPSDELARRLLARGGVAAVHINGGVVTVDLAKGYDSTGLADIIRGLYTFYAPSPDAVDAEPVDAEPAEADVAGQPETHGESVADEADTDEPPAPGEPEVGEQ